MTCGQGGTTVYEVLLLVCFLFSFLTLGARLVEMNFLQSIVSMATVTVFYFHVYHLELVDNNNYRLL